MSSAFIDPSAEWRKNCPRCGIQYGAPTRDGLLKFFYSDRTRPDGFYRKCKECHPKRTKERNRNRVKRANDRAPHKNRARNQLRYAVKIGKIVKPDSCTFCKKSNSKLEGHHTDYTKPLDVVWLCQPCHINEHLLEAKRPSGGES